MTNQRQGLLYALAAFLFWGVIPIFWKQLTSVDSFEIIAHRMIWSCVIVVAAIICLGKTDEFLTLFTKPKILLRSALAGSFIVSNWFMFIWAVTNEHIVQISMGYFINPIISVMIGVLLFGDQLRRRQFIPLSIIVIAIFYQIIAQGELPWVALFLAITFAFYSAVKKTIQLPVIQGMALEMIFFVVPAFLYLFALSTKKTGAFGSEIDISILLMMAGLFTIVPLLLFAAAAKRASMTVLGMTQYVGPSLQLIIGVLLYKELFDQTQLITFCLIWFALIIYSIDEIAYQRKH